MSKDTLGLIYSAIITFGFFIAGIFDVLNLFMVKALLFLAFFALVIYLVIIVMKDIENKNHLE